MAEEDLVVVRLTYPISCPSSYLLSTSLPISPSFPNLCILCRSGQRRDGWLGADLGAAVGDAGALVRLPRVKTLVLEACRWHGVDSQLMWHHLEDSSPAAGDLQISRSLLRWIFPERHTSISLFLPNPYLFVLNTWLPS